MSLVSLLSRKKKSNPGAIPRRSLICVEELEPRQMLSATPLVIPAQADTYLEAAYPTKTHGESTTLRAKLSPEQESLFRFAVTGVSGTVQSAKLRAYVYGNSDDGPRIYATSTNWSEATATWNTRPARLGGPLDDKGVVPVGWVEYDVTSAVTGNGTYSFALVGTSSDGLYLYSREKVGYVPQLVITMGDVAPVVSAGPDRLADEGQAISFAGTFSGGTGPVSLNWTFGDGTSVTGTLNPSHAFADNGIYTVTLTATDALGRVVQDSAIVTVNNVAPIASAGGPYAASAGSPLTFSALANDPSSKDMAAGLAYSWDFGDGSSGSGDNPSHIYLNAGSYTAFLTVRDKDGGTTTATATVTVEGSAGILISDPYLVLSEPSVSKPAYLNPVTDATFGTTLTRIAGDPGTTFTGTNGSGTWGTDVRHHYSKDQPWNSNGTLIALENRGTGATPSRVFLDGETYQVAFRRPSNYPSGEERWHPSPDHPNERIIVKNNKLMWFDVVRNTLTRTWTLPIPVHGIGMGEGNTSADGRYLALVDDYNRMFVVDMESYPTLRMSPIYNLAADGLNYTVSWVSISPSGKYVVVHYSGDYLRVFDVNPVTLALSPRALPENSPRVRGTGAQGFIYDVGHADMTRNPFDNNEDVIIGQEHGGNAGRQLPGVQTVNGAGIGRVVMVRLRDGVMTSLTDPTNEATAHHVSARNVDRPGWVYVTYKSTYPGMRFNDEIVALRIDGSGTVERLGFKHSDSSGNYRAESHAVPSPDGMRVIFASNWVYKGNGTASVVQDYVIDTRPARISASASVNAQDPAPLSESLTLESLDAVYTGLWEAALSEKQAY